MPCTKPPSTWPMSMAGFMLAPTSMQMSVLSTWRCNTSGAQCRHAIGVKVTESRPTYYRFTMEMARVPTNLPILHRYVFHTRKTMRPRQDI